MDDIGPTIPGKVKRPQNSKGRPADLGAFHDNLPGGIVHERLPEESVVGKFNKRPVLVDYVI